MRVIVGIGVRKLPNTLWNKLACIFVIGILGCSSLMGIISLSSDGNLSLVSDEDQVSPNPWSDTSEWLMPDDSGDLVDIRGMLDSFRENADSITHYRTSDVLDSGNGFSYDYEAQDATLTIHVSVDDFGIASYDFEEGNFDALVIPSMVLSTTYGSPTLPYTKIMFNIPAETEVFEVSVRSKSSELLYGLNIVPGPKPVAIYGDMVPDKTLFFDPEAYTSDVFYPETYVASEVITRGEERALMITINPLQYNALKNQGLLHSEFDIDVSYSSLITNDDVEYLGWSDYAGANYTIVTTSEFLPVLTDFIDWKTELGFNVQVETMSDILSGYSGRDDPEKLRTFVQTAYTDNGTEYFLFVGDCDIVPTREVEDPAGGPGLDNGTEPSDLYFECLDGTWDENGNDVFGELNETTDLIPEVKVGRLPVQLPSEAEHVLTQIISYESNPEPGDWLNDFMLIAVDCFGSGDGVVMAEDVLNQKYLYDSFFDTYRYYPTDGSLETTDIITKINSGINVIDFFDHGAYDVWYQTLDYNDVGNFTNGNKSFMAFAMACETAAFDVEWVEPTIGEAFFRAPDGGAHTYIGATRVAWAGYNCFDGLHNKFWEFFFEAALSNRVVRPKDVLQQATEYMVTTFDLEYGPTLESIYQAIYFGDPSLALYWKHNVTTVANTVETGETVTLNGTCLQYNNRPIVDSVDVNVTDPLGTNVYTGTVMTDAEGKYSVSFSANSNPGEYTVETAIAQPFEYTSVTSFTVGKLDVSLTLDSTPLYNTFLDFSGTLTDDCAGSVILQNDHNLEISSKVIAGSGGVFSSSINVTEFGNLRLIVQFDNGTATGGCHLEFKVIRGDVLVIADNAGGYGPTYPGGWADNNYGDGANLGEYVVALQNEYNVTKYSIIQEGMVTIDYLNLFDVVVVSTGDNYGAPLVGSESFLLDLLLEYHSSGGALLIEGGAILQTLDGVADEYFSSLFHVGYIEQTVNTGSLEIVSGSHPIVSGLSSSISLTDGLGSLYADVMSPVNGSIHAAGYGGSYIGGTAIAGLAPSGLLGGIVFIGFSIDGISDDDERSLLIQNSIEFLLNPSLLVTVSDDAMMTGTSDTVYFEVTDSATGGPIIGASVAVTGCGVSITNTTLSDGTCSAIVNPTFSGDILINVTKSGFLGYATSIIVYDTSIVQLEANPAFLERSTTTQVTITATDYYEHFPLENCFVNATGLGNSESDFTNSSGMIDFILTADSAGNININGELAGYLSSEILLPVRVKIIVLPSIGTYSPELCCWDELMLNWNNYGDYPLDIDYTTFQNMTADITFEILEATGADVAYQSIPMEALSTSKIDAIQTWVQTGKGFIATSGAMYLNPHEWSTFFGLQDLDVLEYVMPPSLELDVTNSSHPLMRSVSDPYNPGFLWTISPFGTGWSSDILQGANYTAVEDSATPQAAILEYRGMAHFSNIPEYGSNIDDCQLVYNALTWSDYEFPEHDLTVRLHAPDRVAPGGSDYLNVTVMNTGLNNESSVVVHLYIDESEVDSMTIPTLNTGTSETMSYFWTLPGEGIYNITAYVEPILGEDTELNNVVTRMIPVTDLHDYIMIEDVFTWYDAVENGYQLSFSGDDTSISTSIPFNFPYYDGVFDSVAISSNGWLSFAISDPTELSGSIPSTNPRHAFSLAPLWADLIAEGNIYIWETPERLVIQYEDYNYLGGSLAGTFQVVFYATGQLAFNYQSMGSSLYGTAGLNYGDGTHYNTYSVSALNGATNFGLQFYYELPEHEVGISLDCPKRVNPGDVVDISMAITNVGTSDELGIDFELYIDEIIEYSTVITSLPSGETYLEVNHWSATVLGSHNITAIISEVPGDEIVENNVATKTLVVSIVQNYNMSETTYKWFDAQTNGINIGLSGDDVYEILDLPFSFTYYDTVYDWIAVSSNGWFSFVNTHPYDFSPVSYPTTNPDYVYSLTPIWADLQAESNIYYWETANRVVVEFNDYNYLGGESIGTFQLVLYDYGDIVFNYQSMATVHYGTTGLNHGDGERYNAYSSTSLTSESEFSLLFTYGDDIAPSWLAYPEDFTVEAGLDFTHGFEVTDNTGIETCTVNDTTRFGMTSAGVLYNTEPLHVGDYGIEIVVTDYYDNSVSAEVTVMVRDTLAPTILESVTYVLIEAGTILDLNLTSYDFSGIDSYSVNDTRFAISDSGILTSISALAEGNYSIQVSVIDVYGNIGTLDIEIVAYESLAQSFLMTLILTFAPITIVGIVIILLIRRRMTRPGAIEPSYSIG